MFFGESGGGSGCAIHTLSMGTPSASMATKEDGGGWVVLGELSPSQSHEPRSKVATAVAAEKKKRVCVCS